VDRASRPSDSMKPGAPIFAGPGREDGIVGVPGGLIHHWTGSVFIPDATLRQVMDTTQDYSSYPKVYHAITSARVLQQGDDMSRVLMRLHESAGGLSAVLEVRSTIHYEYPASERAYSIASLDEIRQVENAGTPSERMLPPGRDSGYLWRGNTFTLFVAHEGGVYVETETLGLSRRFPPMLGWIIEPIARRVGRQSVETSLREFQAAVLKRTASPMGSRSMPPREGIVDTRSTSLSEQPAGSNDEHRAGHRGRSAGAASAARLDIGAGV